MGVDPALLAYPACGLLIFVYAWRRFNTPPSNRSSTRQALYWWSGLGYALSALVVFAGLSSLLQVGNWRTALLGPTDQPSLPAPLIATLAMTTLLPSIPVLKRLDEWLLSVFLDWAEIPAEVKRRAAAMTPRSFEVTEKDVEELRETYGDEGDGHAWARHLRARRGDGLELSQHRFTRVVKLYDRIRKLSAEPRYSRFFAEAEDEFAELDRRTAEFLRRSAASLTIAERQYALDEGAVFDELILERREEFAQNCRQTFNALALLLARAVLRSEGSEGDIVRSLRGAGFSMAAPMNLPHFPIDSLTALAMGLFLYLILAGWMFAHVANVTRQPIDGLMMAGKITLVRLVTIGVTVWLMQRYAFFHRMPGDPPRYFAYLINGLIAAAVAFGICLPFDLANAGKALPPSLLSFAICTAVALCCDDWVEDSKPPNWLRLAEAAGCGSVMAVSIALLYFGDVLTFPAGALTPKAITLLIALPSGLALVIGGYVPHIYRSARRAAMRRRDEAKQLAASAHQVQSESPILRLRPLPDRQNGGAIDCLHEALAAEAGDKPLAPKRKRIVSHRGGRGPRPNNGQSASSSVAGEEPGKSDGRATPARHPVSQREGGRSGGDSVEAVKGEKIDGVAILTGVNGLAASGNLRPI